jgi:cobalt-zinc-cadmium efflux system protein
MAKHTHNNKESRKQIKFGIILNGSFTIVEFIVGIISNSLALISDALHDLTDTFALLLSFFASKKAEEKPTETKTWGYHRATILAAFVNGIFLVVLTLFIFYRAYIRILNPEPVKGPLVLGLAVFGILFNGAIVLKLWKSKDRDLNIKSIFWHISEDALGWIGVLIAGIIITFTNFYIIDSIISIAIGIIVLIGAWSIIKEATNILLEGVPEGISVNEVKKELKNIKPIKGVHDIHIWCTGSNYYILSAHIEVPDMKICDTNKIISKIEKVLKEKFNISHTTLAFESKKCEYSNEH